jgi:Cdc6-like AAA superfamily ATPase
MLDLNEITLHGRENEISYLQQIFDKVKQNEGKQTIFVRGESGCGKTSLIKHFGN